MKLHVLQQTLRGYFGIPEVRAHRALADSQVLAAVSHKLLDIAFAMPGIDSWEKLMGKLSTSFGRIGDLNVARSTMVTYSLLPKVHALYASGPGDAWLQHVCPCGHCH